MFNYCKNWIWPWFILWRCSLFKCAEKCKKMWFSLKQPLIHVHWAPWATWQLDPETNCQYSEWLYISDWLWLHLHCFMRCSNKVRSICSYLKFWNSNIHKHKWAQSLNTYSFKHRRNALSKLCYLESFLILELLNTNRCMKQKCVSLKITCIW